MMLACDASVDLILHSVEPAVVERGQLASTVVLLRTENLCPNPRVTLGGEAFPGPVFRSDAGLLLPGGEMLREVLERNAPATPERGCGPDLQRLPLNVDCAGQQASGKAEDGESRQYRRDRAEVEFVWNDALFLGERAHFPSGVEVLPFTAIRLRLPEPLAHDSIEDAAFTLDGVETTTHVTENGRALVLVPAEPLEPGQYTARITLGRDGLQAYSKRCLSFSGDTSLEWSFTVPEAAGDLFQGFSSGRPLRIEWPDFAAERYALFTEDGTSLIGTTDRPQLSIEEHFHAQAFRLHVKHFSGREDTLVGTVDWRWR